MKHRATGRKLTHELCAGEIEIACVEKGGFTFGVDPDGTAKSCPFCQREVHAEIIARELETPEAAGEYKP